VGWIHVFTTLRLETDAFAEIGGLVVAESHRGREIGKRLLDSAEHWVIQRGMPRLRVRSRASRSGAHRFYEQSGFIRTKVQSVFDKRLGDGD
jgi:GNAT superfamily N-acetyltransferase